MLRHARLILAVVLAPGCARSALSRPSTPAERSARAASTVVAAGSTFCNPLDLDYRFALDTPSRRDVANPVIVLLDDAYYLFAERSGGYWRSRDLHDWQLVVPTGLPSEGSPRAGVVGGRMYYASAVSPAVYTSDDPASGAWREATPDEATRAAGASDQWAHATASSHDGGGFAGRLAEASAFRDRTGNRWAVATVNLGAAGATERRLGIFPIVNSASGGQQADSYLGDYPQRLPSAAGAASDGDHNATGWMLLSFGKKATASSNLLDHAPELAFDEDARSWWSASSGGVGEWLSVDLGAIARIVALQINFAEQGTRTFGRDEDSYQQYIVESSIDGVHWTTRLDESGTLRDSPHRYVQLDSARNARFLRITNVHAAAGGNFAIRDLRIFGNGPVALPAPVGGVNVQRTNDRATINWQTAARAHGYIIRFGTAADQLYASYRVGDVVSLTLERLDRATPYWFTVDAIGEGGITRGTGPLLARPGS